MSSRRRFFLCALAAAACSLAARPQGRAQKAAQVDPFAASPQSYAALDLSGTSTHGSPVSLLALDDRNQAAFLFKQASGAGATWQAKLWQNGALGDGQSFPAQAPQPELSALLGGAVVQEYHPMHLQTSGEAVGESVATDSFENSGHGNVYPGPGFRAAEGRCDDLAAPRPYQYQFGNYPAGWGAKLELSALSAQGYGGAFVYTRILTAPPYVVPGSPSPGSPAAFIQQGDVTISFDPDAPGSLADTGTLQVVRRKFQPGALNAKGWALGEPAGWYWGDTGNLLWNGGQRQLVALAGRGVALNEDNDVLVAGVWNPTTQRSEGAHLLAQGDPAKKRVFAALGAGAGAGLLPATAQPHLRNVYPFALSNRVAAPGDGSVQPVLHILFQAEVERSPNRWEYATFVLRLLSDDTTEVQEVVYPQGVTNVQLKSINASGVIAALGNVGPGEKHALLLVPVEVSDLAVNTDTPSTSSIGLGTTSALPNTQAETIITEGRNAYIFAHTRANDSTPDMPHLVAKIAGGSDIGSAKWRLRVTYERPNGKTQTNDQVFVPYSADRSQPTWTAFISSQSAWRIFESIDWQQEIAQRGFFGGKAELYCWLQPDSQPAPTKPVMTFYIAGTSPDRPECTAYVNAQASAADSRLLRLSAAVGRHESKDYNGTGSRYNMFWNTLGHRFHVDHRRGDPLWCKSSSENSAGGFGIFQITGDLVSQFTNIPREQFWNWQKNVDAYVRIVKTGGIASKGSTMDRFFAAVARTYPDDSEAQNPPTNYAYDGGSYDAWEMGAITLYNGAGGCPESRLKNASGKTVSLFNPWKYETSKPAGSKWQYHPNSNKYLHQVIQEK